MYTQKRLSDLPELVSILEKDNYRQQQPTESAAMSVDSSPEEVALAGAGEISPHSETTRTRRVCSAAADFSVLIEALALFLNQQQTAPSVRLPLSGQLPDMTASTAAYVGLQECYHVAGNRDRQRLETLTRAIAEVCEL